MGREVWAINTVEFSNHTGYKAWRGKVLGAALIDEITLGLEERNILGNCQAVLSGYLGDAVIGRAILNAVKRVRSVSPDALYCCDPVMGDVGRGFYVNPDIPNIFKNEVVPLADIITPNQFELEALTGIETAQPEDALKAISALHKAGPKVVLLTSYRRGEATGALVEGEVPEGAPRSAEDCKEIEMIVSDGKTAYSIKTPELYFENTVMMAGSGDLTTAVFLSRYLEDRDIKRALESSAASVYGIIEATHKAGSRELCLVEAQNELVSPSHTFKADKI
jgi:pyridoxine kinase